MPDKSQPRVHGMQGVPRNSTPQQTGGSKLRVLIADDHAMLRQGLCSVLRAQPDFEIIGEAADGHQAVTMARQLKPDIVLMDVTMPELDGVEATRMIKTRASDHGRDRVVCTDGPTDRSSHEGSRRGGVRE